MIIFLFQDNRLLPGAGAIEIELAKLIAAYAEVKIYSLSCCSLRCKIFDIENFISNTVEAIFVYSVYYGTYFEIEFRY